MCVLFFSLQECLQTCCQSNRVHRQHKMDAKTYNFVKALHCCMNTTSRGANKPHHLTHSQVSQVTGLYIIMWTCTARPVLTSLERLLHCTCVFGDHFRDTSLCVYNEFANFSSHTTCTYLDIVCVFSLFV